MNQILNIGKYLFPLSFLLYVGLHFGKPDVGAAMVPDYFPAPYFLNYLTAVFILLFIVSALVGIFDKLAYTLMAVYVLLMALLIHLPRSMGGQSETVMMNSELEMVNVFRNIMVVGALMGFARYVAKDNRIIG